MINNISYRRFIKFEARGSSVILSYMKLTRETFATRSKNKERQTVSHCLVHSFCCMRSLSSHNLKQPTTTIIQHYQQ